MSGAELLAPPTIPAGGDRVRHTSRSLWTGAAVVLAWTSLQAVWLLVHRDGQPLSMDEAGYLTVPLSYVQGAQSGGLGGWLSALMVPSVQAPLGAAVASLAMLATDASPKIAGLGVALGAAAVTLWLTGLLSGRSRRPATQWIAMLFVATSFGFVAMSRTYVFATLAAAVLMWALYSLARSQAMLDLRWSLSFGAAVGMLPLARTMALAFVPVIGLVAALQVCAAEDARVRRVRNSVLAGSGALLVAGSWLAVSWRPVLGYLTSYGYGDHASSYANGAPNPWSAFLVTLTSEHLLTHVCLISCGWLIALFAAARLAFRSRSQGWAVRQLIAQPAFVCAIVAGGGAFALMSSSNQGVGFTIPLLAPAAIVGAEGWAVVATHLGKSSRSMLAVVLATTSALAIAPAFGLRSGWVKLRLLDVAPGVTLVVTDAGDEDPAYPSHRGSAIVNEPSWGTQWSRSIDRLTTDVASDGRGYAFGFRGAFVNVNAVQLRGMVLSGGPVPAVQVDPLVLDPTVDSYARWLSSDAPSATCFLVTSPGSINEATPIVPTEILVEAARGVGYRVIDSVPLPDDRVVTVWISPRTGCDTGG